MPPVTTEQPKVDAPVTDTPVATPPPTPATPDAPAAPTPSPLLVTSSSSRANYAENVNTMNNATANLAGLSSYNFVDKTGKVQTVQAASPEEAMAKAPNADPRSGVQKVEEPTTKTDTGTGTGTPGTGTETGGTAGTGTTNTQGDVDNKDGTTTLSDGMKVPTGLASIYRNTIDSLDQGIADAKSRLMTAAATMKNDPAAQAAIALVLAKYDQQIVAMKEKNRQLMGSNIANAARGGALQYANEMTGNFLSDEQDRAIQRITDLVTLQTQMVLKTKQAYEEGDVKAFEASSKALDKAQKDKLDAIDKMLSATDRVVKENQAQSKIDAANAKQKITDDIRLSTNISASIAENIAAAKITDDKKRRAYIEKMAEANGISNPELLDAAVVKAEQTRLKTEKTLSGGKKTGGGSSSETATQKQVLANIQKRFGSQTPDANGYSVRGADKYIDPGEYVNAYNQWITKYPDKDFLAKFPVNKLINPASYGSLPAALRPAAKKTGSGATPP